MHLIPMTITIIELFAVFACLAAMVFVIRGRKRPDFLPAVPILLLTLLVLMLFYAVSLVLEWSGWAGRLRWHFIEDFAGVFIPVIWAFVFYAFIKNTVEEDLHANRKHFRNLVESTSDWIWEVDAQGRYTYVSPQVKAILGYTPQEILGKTPFDFMPAAEAERMSALFASLLEQAGPLKQIENRNFHKDGHEVVLETSGVPVFDKKGNLTGYRGIDRDITRRKHSEQQALRRQAELDTIFRASPAGIGQVRERHLVRANDRLFEITGYTEGELVGRDPRIFYRTDKEYLEVGEKFAEAAETGFARIETRFVRKDQTVIDVVIYIAPLDRGNPDAGSVLVLQDITELKAARQAALEEKTRSQIYLGVVHVMIVVLDTEGRVKLINKKGCEILERSAEQIEGADWFRTFLPASYQEIARGVFNRIIAGEEKAVEYFENPVRTLDGTEKLIAWHNAVLRDEGGRITGIISSGEDVTNVRAAEEAKRKSEQQLRVALSAAKMGTWRWSAATGRDIFDDNLKKLLGLTEQDADREYQDLFLFAHPDDREAAKAEFDRAIREHDTYLAYFRIVHPSGEIRWVQDQGTPFYDFNGKLEYVTGVVVDVTERKRADEMLQFTQFAVDRAGEAAYWMGPDAKFIYVNDKASQSLGYAREELLTMSVHDIDPDFPSDIWADHWKHMRKNPSSRFESHHQRKDGVVFPVEITSNFVVYNDKEYVCAFARDITERKAAEQEREILMEQLRQRNDELQSIVFTAAHDLRSPLVNIAGFAGELEKSLRQLEEVLKEAPLNKQLIGRIDHLLKTDITESLEFIRFGSRHMDALLNGLMRLSVVGASPIEHSEVEMKVLINHIIEGLRYQINENIVDISVPDDLPNCFGDSTMLTQVFGNLIDNAIKYRHPERAAVVEIGASIQGDMVDYTVADNGIGIESTHLEKVFELFHRLDSKQEQGGQGMGLTIVRRILDRLGGSAKIDSVPGLGTTVHVRLPRA